MSTANILTIVALLLNAVALTVIGYQTWLTRKSLRETRRSVELSTRTMQVEMLPNANWVIRVRVELEMWKKDLEDVIKHSKAASKRGDADQMKALADAGLSTPDGLVSKVGAEHAPSWLSTIWIAGAQYYFDAKAPQTSLWSKGVPCFDYVPNLATRCEDSIRGLQQLLDLIDDVVPKVYLNCPARVNDEKFLD